MDNYWIKLVDRCTDEKVIFCLLIISIIAFSFLVYQYIFLFQIGSADAYNSTRALNGHFWSEMQCTSEICINEGDVGIGTDSPSTKLEINGILKVTDACTAAGICLNAISAYLP